MGIRTAAWGRAAASVSLVALAACDALFTETPPKGELFDSPLDGLTDELRAVFAEGDENFDHAFSVREGVGPIFNQPACARCHPGDGRGSPAEALTRFSVLGDPRRDLGGPQLQDKAIPGIAPEILPGVAGLETTLRLPPPVFGVGLIEGIPVATILAFEDPADADGDGVSGRAHWVVPADFVPASEPGGGPGPGPGGTQLGRFSRKAQVSSLLQQIVEAYHEDIGITSDFLPGENPNAQAGSVALGDDVPDPEIPASTVLETVVYVRLLAPPEPGPIDARAADLFGQIRCATCHVPTLRTGSHDIAPLDEVDVPLYSDLLLHDMGPGLADGRPDGNGPEPATGSEWKTPPLWGTRFVTDFLGGRAFFLHDGRATTVHDAILAHGGEAAGSLDAYLALSPEDQALLREFVETR
jgi:CxxC motif-containing protein (DUF1111 family)